jgi:glycosyltransferase involved in cell wall biosynthesis
MTDADTTLDLCLAVIACDNERTIERTLQSVDGLARRKIVVDSGSTDGTLDICRACGAEVIPHAWEGHVKQKQFALEQCDTPWVLSLDSDESLDEQAIQAVRNAVSRDDASIAGYRLNRQVWIGDRPLRHAWQPEWRTRLVRRDNARWAGFDPHDRLDVEGAVARIGGNIRHDAFIDFEQLLHKSLGHGLTTARSFHEMGKKGSRLQLALSPPAAVLKQLVFRSAWLDGWPG